MGRARALAEILRDPAARALAGGPLDGLGAVGDEGAFPVLAQGAGDHPGGVATVGGEGPAPAQALFDELWVAGQRRGVGGDGGAQPVAVEHLEDAEDAAPRAVFAPGVAADIGPEVAQGVAEAGVAQGAARRVQLPVLEIDHRGEGDPRGAGPAQRCAPRQRREGVEVVVHAGGAVGGHGAASPVCARYHSAISEPVASQTSSWLAMWRSARSSARMRCGWPMM